MTLGGFINIVIITVYAVALGIMLIGNARYDNIDSIYEKINNAGITVMLIVAVMSFIADLVEESVGSDIILW